MSIKRKIVIFHNYLAIECSINTILIENIIGEINGYNFFFNCIFFNIRSVNIYVKFTSVVVVFGAIPSALIVQSQAKDNS